MLAQLAGLGLTLGAGLKGIGASGKAADRAAADALYASTAQVGWLENAIKERQAGTDRSLSFLSPYETQGRGSLKLLSDALGINGQEAQAAYFANFQNDPGFQSLLKTGTDAIEQSAAGSGMLRSGGTLKSLQDYGMRLQQSVFQDRLNRLAGLGTQGQTAATGMAGLADTGSRDVANFTRDIGTAKAGGIINAANAKTAGMQNYLQLLGYGAGRVGQGLNDLFGQFRAPSSAVPANFNPNILGYRY